MGNQGHNARCELCDLPLIELDAYGERVRAASAAIFGEWRRGIGGGLKKVMLPRLET
jgi:hypothetical protein